MIVPSPQSVCGQSRLIVSKQSRTRYARSNTWFPQWRLQHLQMPKSEIFLMQDSLSHYLWGFQAQWFPLSCHVMPQACRVAKNESPLQVIRCIASTVTNVAVKCLWKQSSNTEVIRARDVPNPGGAKAGGRRQPAAGRQAAGDADLTWLRQVGWIYMGVPTDDTQRIWDMCCWSVYWFQ